MSRTYKDTKQHREKITNPVKLFCGGVIPSKYKRAYRRIRRAKERDAFRVGKIIPLFKGKGSDEWNWW